jgi:hypothetical protein
MLEGHSSATLIVGAPTVGCVGLSLNIKAPLALSARRHLTGEKCESDLDFLVGP